MTGGLIQMNAHMICTDWAVQCIVFGGIAAAVGIIIMVWVFLREGLCKSILTGVLVLVMGVGFLIHGANIPRVKEIKACASGPVSLEQVAALYQIVEVDGKMLTLRER